MRLGALSEQGLSSACRWTKEFRAGAELASALGARLRLALPSEYQERQSCSVSLSQREVEVWA